MILPASPRCQPRNVILEFVKHYQDSGAGVGHAETLAASPQGPQRNVVNPPAPAPATPPPTPSPPPPSAPPAPPANPKQQLADEIANHIGNIVPDLLGSHIAG